MPNPHAPVPSNVPEWGGMTDTCGLPDPDFTVVSYFDNGAERNARTQMATTRPKGPGAGDSIGPAA